MADSCDLLLRAAELLDHTKLPAMQPQFNFSLARDDAAVPNSEDEAAFGDFMDSGDDTNSLEGGDEGFGSKRPRAASLKGARLAARDAVAHNSVEKRRRAYLASCYDNLKRVVPALAGTRASNVKVLRGGLAYIKSLEAEDRRLVAEKKRAVALRESLIRQNNLLAKQLFRNTSNEYTVPTVVPIHASLSKLSVPDSEEVAMSLMLLAELCPVRC